MTPSNERQAEDSDFNLSASRGVSEQLDTVDAQFSALLAAFESGTLPGAERMDTEGGSRARLPGALHRGLEWWRTPPRVRAGGVATPEEVIAWSSRRLLLEKAALLSFGCALVAMLFLVPLRRSASSKVAEPAAVSVETELSAPSTAPALPSAPIPMQVAPPVVAASEVVAPTPVLRPARPQIRQAKEDGRHKNNRQDARRRGRERRAL